MTEVPDAYRPPTTTLEPCSSEKSRLTGGVEISWAKQRDLTIAP
jgi:hypothetical protein